MEKLVLIPGEEKRNRFLSDLNTEPKAFLADLPTDTTYLNRNLCCLFDTTLLPTYLCQESDVRPLGRSGKVASIYLVTSKQDGRRFVIKQSEVTNLSSTLSSVPPSSVEAYQQGRSGKECLLPDVTDLTFVGSDEFLNETLIGFYLDHVFHASGLYEMGLRTYVQYLDVSLCPHENTRIGLQLLSYADGGTLEDIPTAPAFAKYRYLAEATSEHLPHYQVEIVQPDILMEMLKQLILTLYLLQTHFTFIHGDLKVSNVFVSFIPLHIRYSGTPLDADFQCQIADYGKSSITMALSDGNYRFYPRSFLAETYLTLFPFTPEIFAPTSNRRDDYYVITERFNFQVYTHTRHQGLPFYPSLDTYTLILSMAQLPGYYYPLLFNDRLRTRIWDRLWFDQEGEIVRDRVVTSINNNEPLSIETSLNILRGIRLKCAATQILYQSLFA